MTRHQMFWYWFIIGIMLALCTVCSLHIEWQAAVTRCEAYYR